MKKNLNRGFTLIELLIVIAIIGILASIVLASLNTARAKGADAAIKSSLTNARAQAAIFYDNQDPHTYDGVCNDGADTIYRQVTQAGLTSGLPQHCYSDDDEWVATARLKTDPTVWYCVDHKGASVEIPESTKNFDTDPGDTNWDCD